MKNNKIWMTILSILVAICLCLNIYNFYTLNKNNTTEYYTLYVGTNDKDTYKLEMPIEDAFNKVDSICNKYLGGVTLSMATGSWTDEKGEITHENTIQVVIYDAKLEDIYKVSDELIKELNQSSILISKGNANVVFYSGKK